MLRDTTDDEAAYVLEPALAKLYPIWIPAGPGAAELLVAYNNRPAKDLARRFFIRGNRVVRTDTLLTFAGPARDVDHDGRLEYAGYYDYGEVWEEGRRLRTTYNPTLYYEVRPTGLVLDSALTKRRILAQYGRFYGFRYSDKPVVYQK